MQFIDWLISGDVSIAYQTYRDLLGEEREDLRQRIASEGWGAMYLAARRPDGHWGKGFYQPKWTSTHYTLLDLRNLCIPQEHPKIRESVERVALECKGVDGGINPHRELNNSDVCINGMFLNYACYFKIDERLMDSVVDFTLSQRMPDGGFNCQSNRKGARHSSLHSTLSVLEGIHEYAENGYTYRLGELKDSARLCIAFILMHQFFISDRTGEIIKKDFLKLTYPGRWRYDILRALDLFQFARVPWDDRMSKAVEVLLQKRNKEGTWNLQAKHPGQEHFAMEIAGKPSRWNTLRALRVLKYYGVEF